jgi:hypothetical protein
MAGDLVFSKAGRWVGAKASQMAAPRAVMMVLMRADESAGNWAALTAFRWVSSLVVRKAGRRV